MTAAQLADRLLSDFADVLEAEFSDYAKAKEVRQAAAELRALGGEYYVLAGYFDADGDFMHATMWANSDWATDSGYTIPCYIKQERDSPAATVEGSDPTGELK